MFETSFPVKYKNMSKTNNDRNRNSNDPITKAYYIKYCKILNKVIKEAKSSIIVDL
jgi:hypothetical protein